MASGESGVALRQAEVGGRRAVRRAMSGSLATQVAPAARDDGQLLTEGPVIVQYLADLKPAAGLAPANGSMQRYRLQEWLGYINAELHKSFGPLFNPAISAEARAERVAYLNKRYALVESALKDRPYLPSFAPMAAPLPSGGNRESVTSYVPVMNSRIGFYVNALATQPLHPGAVAVAALPIPGGEATNPADTQTMAALVGSGMPRGVVQTIPGGIDPLRGARPRSNCVLKASCGLRSEDSLALRY